ncbi:hypothetical protein [Pseudolysinimonas yzui]|uniref:Uncharacterized protein n=1 Tax=Pseudolysinimonas yzui TaxID=2708254 RepID=A0A8J3GQN8_9MICO|nr:hypothetical protein [Pseudolysinimonas yzui]GHF15604.1 hypothetical protein GCM10011600_15790 [Pseudolysinimonas yzui]
MSPRTVLISFLAVDVILLIGYLVSREVLYSVPQPSHFRFHATRLFDIGGEPTLATWWAVGQLLVGAALMVWAGVAARRRRQPAVHWFVFGGILAYISIDEQAEIHETLVEPVRKLFGITTGPLLLAWVIPALVAVALVLVFVAAVVRALPRVTFIRLAIGAMVFLVGAIGMEMVDSATFETLQAQPTETLRTAKHLMTAIEEVLELVGVTLVVWAVLSELAAGRRGDEVMQIARNDSAVGQAVS